jgi:hypothetical protein
MKNAFQIFGTKIGVFLLQSLLDGRVEIESIPAGVFDKPRGVGSQVHQVPMLQKTAVRVAFSQDEVVTIPIPDAPEI